MTIVRLQMPQAKVMAGLEEKRGDEKEYRHQGPRWIVMLRGMMGKRKTDAPGDLFTPARELTGGYLIKGLDGPGDVEECKREAAVRSRGEERVECEVE